MLSSCPALGGAMLYHAVLSYAVLSCPMMCCNMPYLVHAVAHNAVPCCVSPAVQLFGRLDVSCCAIIICLPHTMQILLCSHDVSCQRMNQPTENSSQHKAAHNTRSQTSKRPASCMLTDLGSRRGEGLSLQPHSTRNGAMASTWQMPI